MRLFAFCLLLLVSCAENRPPFRAESGRIVAYAFDFEVAGEVAEHASACLSDVEFLTGVTLDASRRPQVWQKAEALARPNVLSFYAYGADRVTLGRVALYDHGHQLAHELTHMLGDQPGTWIQELPQFLEEGLADYIACMFAQELDRQVRWARARLAGRTLDLTELWSAPRDVSRYHAMRDLYDVGLLAVHGLGIDGLREHARVGSLSPAIVAAALDGEIE